MKVMDKDEIIPCHDSSQKFKLPGIWMVLYT